MSLSSRHINITISGKADMLTIVATTVTIYDFLVMGELAKQLLEIYQP
jgi:hypothetical protein